MTREIIQGDAVTELRKLPAESVDCVMTSPPYWALRDYGTPGQLGLEATPKEHLDAMVPVFAELKRVLKPTGNLWFNYGDTVVKKHKLGLGWRLRFRLNDELGLISRADVVWHKPNAMPLSMKDRVAPKHEMLFHFVKQRRYHFDLDAIRQPFAESSLQRIQQPDFDQQTGGPKDYGPNHTQSARRALRNLKARTDNTWAARRGQNHDGKGPAPGQKPQSTQRGLDGETRERERERESRVRAFNVRVSDVQAGRAPLKWGDGVKASDAEVTAYAEGRGKTERDQERDDSRATNGGGWKNANRPKQDGPAGPLDRIRNGFNDRWDESEDAGDNVLGANPGDVWSIPSQPLKEAHFATYPEELVRRVILSSCPKEVCVKCGKPRTRIVESGVEDERGRDRGESSKGAQADAAGSHRPPGKNMIGTGRAWHATRGFTDCGCAAGFRPGLVLDPFFGSGTTGKVAAELGRDFIGIEISEAYVKIARRRLGALLSPLDSFPEADA